jgi:O-antigen ligase
MLASDLLLLAQIFAIPLMKPAVSGQVIAADLLFVLLVVTLGVEALAGLRRVRWLPAYGVLLAYVACLVPSLLATSDLRASLFKLATEFYLIGLAAVPAFMIDNEASFRRAILAWLATTAFVCLVGILGLLSYVTGLGTALLNYSSFGFGSLPPGDYPRLGLTFLNANMACNYLTVSVGLTFLAGKLGYVNRAACWLLIGGIAVASLSTVSPGLGGIALLAAIFTWHNRRGSSPAIAKASIWLGAAVAGMFVAALALTPFAHSTATFVVHLPGGLTVYPAPRLLIWIAALKEFLAHPLVGIGIGIDPVHVGFASPSGYEVLTDAHNLFLSIAAQCGLVGLIGLAAIISFVAARTRPAPGRSGPVCFILGATFLDVFVYQGLGGSFEDARHIWVLLGLLIAAAQIHFSRADGNSRKAAAPLPC